MNGPLIMALVLMTLLVIAATKDDWLEDINERD